LMSNYMESTVLLEISDPAIARLVSLFPNVSHLDIPIHVMLPLRAKGAIETTNILFGANDTAIFLTQFPLWGGEAVRVKPAAGVGEAPAVVVAVVPQRRGFAVAVRFHDAIPSWYASA
jgi:hypothetical protein